MDFCTVVGRLIRTVSSGCSTKWSQQYVQARSGMSREEFQKAIRWLVTRNLVRETLNQKYSLAPEVEIAWKKSLKKISRAHAYARVPARTSNEVRGSMSERSERIHSKPKSLFSDHSYSNNARARSENGLFSAPLRNESEYVPNELIFEQLKDYPTKTEIQEGKKLHYVYRLTIESRKSKFAPIKIESWDELTIGWKGFLVRGAKLAKKLGVSYKRFVSAQFWWFNKFDRDKHGYVKLPQLNHLVGDGAQERVEAYIESLEEDHDRDSLNRTEEATQTSHARETRKLGELRKLLGVTSKEVLRLVPTDFSRQFLEHHNVWSDVSEQWISEHD